MPAPGTLLADRYRILGPLGSGGMATVHRAHDERLDRDVAVKILLPNHAGDPVLATRFEREARALAAAAHPGVVAVYDVDPGDPAFGIEPYFVMELCDGGSLGDRIVGGRRLSPDDLIPILNSVADGLAGLHARGVVHRDVKPSNILLTSTRAKLADFGLARSDDPAQSSDLTAPGTAVGTMGYLAPEVLAGNPAAPAADVYALGVAAFAGLTGAMPRRATSIAELVAAGAERPPLVSEVAPELGTAFDGPIAAALDRDPARRPDALSLGAALTTALGRWSRSRHAIVPPVPSDGDATTAAIPVRPRPTASIDRRPRTTTTGPERRSTGRRSWPGLLAAAAIAALVIAAFALAAGQLGTRSPGGTSATLPVAVASTSPSVPPSPSPSPTASPTPTPHPTPQSTPTVAERALGALGGVEDAIEAARGDGGLKGKEANELERRARDIRESINDGDLDEAEDRARSLQSAVRKLDRDLDESAGRRLENAIDALIEILRDR
jgi:serine/threonine-protein kinase